MGDWEAKTMPEPTGQHTPILQQEPGYENGNGAGHTVGILGLGWAG